MMYRIVRHRKALAAACSAVAAVCLVQPALRAAESGDAAHVEREATIFERQQIMEQLSRDAELLGNIAAGLEPASKLPAVTASIARAANESVAAFAPQVPGGRSKPEVWSNHADFTQRMQTFARNADAMAKVGQTGNVVGVTELMIDALPCKQCHDLYRGPKLPTS